MSAGLLSQLETYYTQLDEGQRPIHPDEVAAQVDSPVRVMSSSVPTEQHRGWLVIVAVAVVVVIGTATWLFGVTRSESPSAPPPIVTTTLPESTSTVPVQPSASSTWFRIPHEEAIFGEAMMRSVTVGGPGLVAVGWIGSSPSEGHVDGDAAVWTSVDGTTWMRVAPDEAVFGESAMESVTAGGPGLVAVGRTETESGFYPTAWTSTDGITWERIAVDVPREGTMNSVTAGGPGLVAVGDVDSGAAVWTSTDGSSWNRVPHDEAVFGTDSDLSMDSVTSGGPGLVAVGLDWSSGDADGVVWTSIDGINWALVPDAKAIFGGPGNQAAVSVVAGGPGVVAVGVERTSDIDAVAWTSPDGIAWEEVPYDEDSLYEGQMWSVTAGDAGLVAVGWIGWVATQNSDAAVWTSSDGITWKRVPHDESIFRGVEMWDVTFGGPGIVAVGSDGPNAAVWVSTSENGLTP